MLSKKNITNTMRTTTVMKAIETGTTTSTGKGKDDVLVVY